MRRFGLVGKTLKHSFSKKYFEHKFAEEAIHDCTYDNFELYEIAEITQLLADHKDLRGLNVTIPFKEAVLSYLNESSESVQAIGACSCIRITDGNLEGFNTDAVAFRQSLQRLLRAHHKCALVLGTGGASKAVQFALRESGIDYLLVSRNKSGFQLGYEDIGRDVIETHQVIINTTPLGMYPNVDEDPPIPYEYLSARHLLYDLTYNPSETKFLRKGMEKGAATSNGYEMLVLQAEESWRLWNA